MFAASILKQMKNDLLVECRDANEKRYARSAICARVCMASRDVRVRLIAYIAEFWAQGLQMHERQVWSEKAAGGAQEKQGHVRKWRETKKPTCHTVNKWVSKRHIISNSTGRVRIWYDLNWSKTSRLCGRHDMAKSHSPKNVRPPKNLNGNILMENQMRKSKLFESPVIHLYLK